MTNEDITTLNGENIINILLKPDEYAVEYIKCWKERINEEINTRISTGVVTPISVLPWCIRGMGWETLDTEVMF